MSVRRGHHGAYYPLFADLHGRRCVVVGGGLVAQRKVTTLLSYGADVTLVSPSATEVLRRYARAGRMRHVRRRFRAWDLAGAWLVIAATSDPATNGRVSRSARRRRIFTNVVDQTPLCSFIAPSVFRRDPLTIAVSTGGASPTIAKRLRRELEARIGSEYTRMLRLMQSLRGVAKRRLPEYDDRKRYFDRLVAGSVFRLVRQGRLGQARARALRLLDAATRN